MRQQSDLPQDWPWAKKLRQLRKENPRYTKPPQPLGATIERYIEAKAIEDYHRIAAVHDFICQLVSEMTLDDPLSPDEKVALAKNKKRTKLTKQEIARFGTGNGKAESVISTAKKLFEKVSYNYDQRLLSVSTTGKQIDGKLYTCGSKLDHDQVYDEKHGWSEYRRGSNVGCALPTKEMIDAVVNGEDPRRLIEKVMNA